MFEVIHQVGGNHYGLPYQVARLWAETDMPAVQGTILKYIVRAPRKGGQEDILKAQSLVPLFKPQSPRPQHEAFLRANIAVFTEAQYHAARMCLKGDSELLAQALDDFAAEIAGRLK